MLSFLDSLCAWMDTTFLGRLTARFLGILLIGLIASACQALGVFSCLPLDRFPRLHVAQDEVHRDDDE